MFTLKVGKVENYEDIEQRETRLRVPFTIVNEAGETVAERIESFPLATTLVELEEALKRHLDVYTADHERYEAGKARQATLDQSAELSEQLSNKVIN